MTAGIGIGSGIGVHKSAPMSCGRIFSATTGTGDVGIGIGSGTGVHMGAPMSCGRISSAIVGTGDVGVGGITVFTAGAMAGGG